MPILYREFSYDRRRIRLYRRYSHPARQKNLRNHSEKKNTPLVFFKRHEDFPNARQPSTTCREFIAALVAVVAGLQTGAFS